MRLYNTLSRRVEDLTFPTGVVRMYVCGITPYDTSHLGHARVGVVYDTLVRYLRSQGLEVRYVQNVTDVDDPLFERARRDGVDWRDLAEQQTRRYLESMARLNVAPPTYYVRASSVIPQMIRVIERLIALGHAYVRNGAVYYRIATQPDFGAIAHADRATLLRMANEMGNHPDDPNKLDPLDFVLWQPSAPDEPAWESPWGPGRPGWHIECSTMATEYLGPQVDIHGGGADLIFPHHACEIAQAEPVTGVRPFVRCWMHTGLVSLGGIKMSKSLGNMVFVDDVLRRYSPAALRLAILSYPYRQDFEYSEDVVRRAEAQVSRVRDVLAAQGQQPLDAAPYQARFLAALEEDFQTPTAIAVLLELADALHEADGGSPEARQQVRTMLDVLGLQI
ncbi:cysteine--tRNA ligase [Kallotenue papyrolyticum]|uniref:cysteine--tRNA ligase n=1 Tax=Kallotenue papyrolyticum TaxID=1325125 RepID=UPI00047852CF|nr:cysteine--tRNA ligase [Kallotenue papyrolyticum]